MVVPFFEKCVSERVQELACFNVMFVKTPCSPGTYLIGAYKNKWLFQPIGFNHFN
jgi:hypothetical protein